MNKIRSKARSTGWTKKCPECASREAHQVKLDARDQRLRAVEVCSWGYEQIDDHNLEDILLRADRIMKWVVAAEILDA